MKTRKWPWQGHPAESALLQVFQGLETAGYQALLAGGAVRDHLLGRPIADFDIATSALPQQVQSLFDRVLMVGESFGVCRVVMGDFVFEVATFRADGPGTDGRRPQTVKFTSAKEDALRRDFTVNGLFMEVPSGQILDYVGGQEDIQRKQLRAIGQPKLRFQEDYLRILRGLRFYAQLDVEIEKETEHAMMTERQGIGALSAERIYQEWSRLLKAPGAQRALLKSLELNIWPLIFGAQSKVPCVDQWSRIFPVIQPEGKDYGSALPWSVFLLDQWRNQPEIIFRIIKSLKMPNRFKKQMDFTLRHWNFFENLAEQKPEDVAMTIGEPLGAFALDVYKALNIQGWEKDAVASAWVLKCQRTMALLENGLLPEAKVKGQHLLEKGVKPGPQMALLLNKAHKQQLLEPALSWEDLLEKILKNNNHEAT